MKCRCLFLTEKRQAEVPDGWEIYRVDVVNSPKGKPQFMLLLTKEKEPKNESEAIGFKLEQKRKKNKL